ncbi:MAG TPA: hypothetical protein VK843_21905 [Planctomycetota bacterium]|nr:hypothetical protein [Planctomycetota bacterium]
MKLLSAHAQQLVNALRRRKSIGERLLGRASAEVAVLEELRSFPEPAVVPHLLPFVFSAKRAVAGAAATTLEIVLRVVAPAGLLQVEEACGGEWYSLPLEPEWSERRTVDEARLRKLGPVPWPVAGVASFHRSGYVRETAVAVLDAWSDGRELPFLLNRLNDWVEPVAARARLAVEKRLAAPYAAAFLDNLAILQRLSESGRRDHRMLIESVYRLLRAPEQEPVLRLGRSSPDRSVRRTSFRLAREAPQADLDPLLKEALRDSDTVIRIEAVTDARGRMTTTAFASALALIVADPYPPIRRKGLVAAAEVLGAEANPWLVSALLDRNPDVRGVARDFLGQRGIVSDFAAVYRDRIDAGRPARELATALAGLGETGAKADAAVIVPCLEHERPKVRAACLRALTRLDLEANIARIAAMLRDPAPAVSREARKLLAPHVASVGLDVLRSLLRDAPHEHSRLDAVSLASSLSKWESLPFLLEATSNQCEPIRAAATKRLDAWIARINKSFTPPTATQLDTIRQALDIHQSAINPTVVAELRSVLGYWDSAP